VIKNLFIAGRYGGKICSYIHQNIAAVELIPINQKLEDNPQFLNNPLCRESLYMTIDFFKRVGYEPPWVSYYAEDGHVLVGCAAFKGAPRNGSVEIAYGTFEPFRQKGVGTQICRLLVELALQTDSNVTITARTLPEKNFSTRILEKNGFLFSGIVDDPEDGEVWEWVYPKATKQNEAKNSTYIGSSR